MENENDAFFWDTTSVMIPESLKLVMVKRSGIFKEDIEDARWGNVNLGAVSYREMRVFASTLVESEMEASPS